MKELTIEQKAQRYDEAIEKLHEIITMDNRPVNPKEIGAYLFPELVESEDEKVRKAILEMIHDTTGDSLWIDYNVHKEDAIAWLEKRGQTFTKKDIDDAYLKGICDTKRELEKQGEHANFRNKIQIGDKVTRNEDGVLVNLSQLNRVAKKQGEQKPTLPKWKYKNDNTPLLRDSITLNKYGCVAQSPSGALVSDVWVIDYDELSKLPKEEIEGQGEPKPINKVEPKFREGDWIVIKQ